MKTTLSMFLTTSLALTACGGGGSSSSGGDNLGAHTGDTNTEQVHPIAETGLATPSTQAVVVPAAGDALKSGTAQLRVHLTDAPNPAIDSAVVTIDAISVHATGEAPFNVLNAPRTLDLLDYQNGLTTLMGELELPAGKYTQLRLSVTDGTVLSEGSEYDVFVPSGSVKVNRPFDICAGGEVDLVFDFDALKSLKYNKGKDEFMLKPVVKIASVESSCPDVEEVDEGEGVEEPTVYEGPTGWIAFELPPVETELFTTLTTQLDDVRVHDQGLGQISVLAESYDINLLEADRQMINEDTGEVSKTLFIPPVAVPVGTLDQVRLLLQPIVATNAEGKTLSFSVPEEADVDQEGLKFFDEIKVCEGALTVVRWDYVFDSTQVNFDSGETDINIHPVVQSVNVTEECVAYEPPST
ncbi:DUF4382 domain-containing protein [Gilvimarinus algae]|uniref:DUF4382 domain-containing protein n=1 Tax=Gilvimarinus algae TaxID=3058037 RepID=A0ABT8TEG8_9GAMM|nr:DUF4382 domain-containing protein [Gilvimarinus sp. SDUM040014]MDO3382443.1 DUF4382 domain-containing protein [Gilvimarinus sp. SDUM040014]